MLVSLSFSYILQEKFSLSEILPTPVHLPPCGMTSDWSYTRKIFGWARGRDVVHPKVLSFDKTRKHKVILRSTCERKLPEEGC